MTDRYNMEEIQDVVKQYKEGQEVKNTSPEMNNQVNSNPVSEDKGIIGITENVVADKLSTIVYKSDSSKSVTEQIEEAAEVGATVKAVASEDIQEKMASAKGEQLIENVREKAASARAERVKAETEESKAKREQNEAMLGIFNADKHYPEWFRKIVIAMFTPFYVILLLAIGVPTGVLRFTLECIDGILVRYESVDDKRKPKVRITFWVLLIIAIIASILFPLLKYFNII